MPEQIISIECNRPLDVMTYKNKLNLGAIIGLKIDDDGNYTKTYLNGSQDNGKLSEAHLERLKNYLDRTGIPYLEEGIKKFESKDSWNAEININNRTIYRCGLRADLGVVGDLVAEIYNLVGISELQK
jgi:hypothetical protein